MDYIGAAYFYAGRIRRLRVIGIHVTDTPARGPRPSTARGVASYFASGERRASTHVTFDDREGVRSVDEDDTAFGIEGLNSDGYHVEHVGTLDDVARWARDPAAVPTLELSARHVADVCKRRRIEPVRLAGTAIYDPTHTGLVAHMDADKARGDLSPHGDPGQAFPWEWYLGRVRHHMGHTPAPEEDDDMPAPTHITAVVNCPNGGYYKVSAEGGVFAYDGAPFFHSMFDLPPEQRVMAPGEYVVGLALELDANRDVRGYKFVTNHSDDYDTDDFPRAA